MYKIKEKMDQIENNTVQQEQIRKRLEEVGGDGKKPPSRGGAGVRAPG